jgi:hypothetical protein
VETPQPDLRPADVQGALVSELVRQIFERLAGGAFEILASNGAVLARIALATPIGVLEGRRLSSRAVWCCIARAICSSASRLR